jgi:hypothetical protein
VGQIVYYIFINGTIDRRIIEDNEEISEDTVDTEERPTAEEPIVVNVFVKRGESQHHGCPIKSLSGIHGQILLDGIPKENF